MIGCGEVDDRGLARQRDGQPADPRGDVRVAHGDRVARHDLELHAGAVGRGDARRDPRDEGAHELAGLGDTVRIVPSISTVSGMTLLVVPPLIRAIVRTAGSNGSTERVVAAWSARTSSAAVGIGSRARWGAEAWPPRPRTVARIASAEASSAPGRRAMVSAGYSVPMWIANARATGPGAVRALLEQALLEHEPGAVVALLARLEHQQDPPGEVVPALHEQARGTQEHGDVRVVAAAVHRARVLGRELEARVLGQRQAVHVGPQQDRRARARALDDRDHRVGRLARPALEPDRAQRLDHHRLRPREPEADLGAPVEPAADLDDVGEHGAGGRQERMDRGGFAGHEGSLLATRTPPDCRTPACRRAPADGTMPRLVEPSGSARQGGRRGRSADDDGGGSLSSVAGVDEPEVSEAVTAARPVHPYVHVVVVAVIGAVVGARLADRLRRGQQAPLGERLRHREPVDVPGHLPAVLAARRPAREVPPRADEPRRVDARQPRAATSRRSTGGRCRSTS